MLLSSSEDSSPDEFELSSSELPELSPSVSPPLPELSLSPPESPSDPLDELPDWSSPDPEESLPDEELLDESEEPDDELEDEELEDELLFVESFPEFVLLLDVLEDPVEVDPVLVEVEPVVVPVVVEVVPLVAFAAALEAFDAAFWDVCCADWFVAVFVEHGLKLTHQV